MDLALEQVRRAAQREASPAYDTITTFMGMTPKQILFLRNYWVVRNQSVATLDAKNIPEDSSWDLNGVPCQCDPCRRAREVWEASNHSRFCQCAECIKPKK